MVAKRVLPEARNPLVEPGNSPSHEILIERRRLGQTNLAVKPGAVGITNATKPEHLGTFDYAHLRVPLPKDLSGSGIFTLKNTTSYPESYFLMRRSSDGYISATGMFKAAFPWASIAEEEAERKYQKTFHSAGQEEVAGSVWIAPEEALTLSEQYGMRMWVEALLDPTPIERGTKDKHNTHIQPPPLFDITKANTAAMALPPSSSLRATRARSSRSVSPSKIATPSRKIATPSRKSRAQRAAKSELKHLLGDQSTPQAPTPSAVQAAVENGVTMSDSVASESGDVKETETLHIEVQETVEEVGDVETTTTNVKIDMPATHPDLPEPEDPTELIKQAQEMVKAAKELEAGPVTAPKAKRKADDLSKDEDEVERPSLERPAKLARTMSTTEQKLAKEKVTRRALVGLGVMAAIGSAVGYFAGLA